jgi:hypothetical protein
MMTQENGKYKCECGKMAVWIYAPASKDEYPYYCDDCVVSDDNEIGCSCMWHYSKDQEGLPLDLPEGIEGKDWKWIEYEGDDYMGKITKEEGFWIYLDSKGKPNPCVEYWYDKDGFDIDDDDE